MIHHLRLHSVNLLPPVVVHLLGDIKFLTDFRNLLSLVAFQIRLTQLRDDLVH